MGRAVHRDAPSALFDPPRAINETTLAGRSVLELIEHGIAAVNLHTNLDCAPGGVNDALAAKLELDNVRILNPAGEDDAGRPYGLLRRRRDRTDRSCGRLRALSRRSWPVRGLRFADAGSPCASSPSAVGAAAARSMRCSRRAVIRSSRRTSSIISLKKRAGAG